MKSEWLFRIAIIVSVIFHGAMLARQQNWFGQVESRVVHIPVVLETAPTPEPTPPPPPPKPKQKPKDLRDEVTEVVKSDGLRAGELTDANVGSYNPGPPPTPPPVDKKKLLQKYLSQVRSLLASRKIYPFSAQRMNITGVVKVGFTILPSGQFASISVKRSSGNGVLDNAAIQTVKGQSGKIKRPSLIGGDPIRTSITFRYQLN